MGSFWIYESYTQFQEVHMRFGYARVSKNEQSLDVQIQKLTEAGCDEIFQEKISGAKEDRPQLQALIQTLRKGDTLCVVRLDRLGRRMMKLVELITEFKTKGIEFIALENNLDTSTPIGMLLFNICAAFSEMERELIRERVQAGLDSARRQGRKGGRPKALTEDQAQAIRALRQADSMSVKKICDTMNVSRSVFYRCINQCV